jgi:glycosyltransferase involved in cell wall biosynthesis
LNNGIFKILDPHYAVGENIDVLNQLKDNRIKYFFEKRRLYNNIKMEREVVRASDLLLPLSKRNYEEFRKISPSKQMLLIPDGANLKYYLSYPSDPDPETILFYGAMSSDQNRSAFNRFYNNIYPRLRQEFPSLKLLVVGSGPPEELKALHDGSKIIVTGFVKDVRPWLSKAWFNIIPLELGSGFRGRVIELMAMGVPVVGTHNALDSIGIENCKHGFISNSDDELTIYSLNLLRDSSLRIEISKNAIDFVKKNYSLEATFGKLNKFLTSRPFNGFN